MRKTFVLLLFIVCCLARAGAAYAEFTGGSYDGYSSAVSADTAIGGADVTISSRDNQVFMASASSTAILPIQITDATGVITAANDIRIIIPSGLNMTWDASDTTAALGGNAAGKCSTTVSYESSNKILVINVTSNFSAGDILVVSGLSFNNFSAASNAARLGINQYGGQPIQAYDDKYLQIISASDVVFTGGSADGYDYSISADYKLNNNLTFEGLKLDGLNAQ